MKFARILLLSLLIGATGVEILPSDYFIKPISLSQFEECEESSGDFYLCSRSSLLLDSIHGPQVFSPAALNQFYTEVSSGSRIVFRFPADVHLNTVQIYYYLTPSSARTQRVTLTFYSILAENYHPRRNIPPPPNSVQLKFLIGVTALTDFSSVCIQLNSSLMTLLIVPSLDNTRMYISEVNFFSGTVPSEVCHGMFNTATAADVATPKPTTTTSTTAAIVAAPEPTTTSTTTTAAAAPKPTTTTATATVAAPEPTTTTATATVATPKPTTTTSTTAAIVAAPEPTTTSTTTAAAAAPKPTTTATSLALAEITTLTTVEEVNYQTTSEPGTTPRTSDEFMAQTATLMITTVVTEQGISTSGYSTTNEIVPPTSLPGIAKTLYSTELLMTMTTIQTAMQMSEAAYQAAALTTEMEAFTMTEETHQTTIVPPSSHLETTSTSMSNIPTAQKATLNASLQPDITLPFNQHRTSVENTIATTLQPETTSSTFLMTKLMTTSSTSTPELEMTNINLPNGKESADLPEVAVAAMIAAFLIILMVIAATVVVIVVTVVLNKLQERQWQHNYVVSQTGSSSDRKGSNSRSYNKSANSI